MVEPFVNHQAAAMALLTAGAPLKRNEGQFLGETAFDANPLTAKQADWIAILLTKHGLPPLAVGGE
ncbi:hypothetical protein O6V14_03040 [Sphingomonas faeni]|uniref:hypothetical protein n=1 Tax=Sphingomonas faeni TaxID=185950 RepID=UPI00334532FB